MIVRARAGTSVADLHAEIGAKGQRTGLPSRGGTIGGAISVGENDLAVLGRGRVRDAVLLIRYVSAEGKLISCGAPTVKNVSGFDLPRLIVGSLGTLGMVAEVILRTNPVPQVSIWLESGDSDPFAVRERLLRPSAILWNGNQTWIQVEGHPSDVGSVRVALDQLGTWHRVEGSPALPPHRWSLRPSGIRHLDQDATGVFVASIGVGTIFAERPQPVRSASSGLAALAARIKHTFDPTNRLSPGRDLHWSG
jgi:FAD/FMN-containing dehydrogenase